MDVHDKHIRSYNVSRIKGGNHQTRIENQRSQM
jgi:hypothetical protein